MNKQEKQIFTSDKLKETAIMTIAVGIIAAAVYFFLIPSMTSISSISALAIVMSHYIPLHVYDHNDIERCPTADRLCDMRKGVRSKDGLHQHPAAVVSCSI